MTTYVGQGVKRTEDPPLITGEGRYVDDMRVPGMLHAAFLRSLHAHARIKAIDVSGRPAYERRHHSGDQR